MSPTLVGTGSDGGDPPDRLVHVFDQNEIDLGIMPWRHALKLAKKAGLHLVIKQWDANPPIARFSQTRSRRSGPPLLNKRIRNQEVRLIDEDRTDLGIVPLQVAQQMAKERGLDLFIVQPDTDPPVAKLMDYGKFKFEQEKKARETKRKHHIVDVKEIKMRYQIEEHDYQIKLQDARKFLNDGDKVTVLMILRGREIQHKDLALKLMQKFATDLSDDAIIDREPKMEGKSALMILTPLK